MKILFKILIFVGILINFSFAEADISSKEDLKKHLIANGLSWFQPNGTIRSMTFSPNGKAVYNNQELNRKQEWIWEIIDSKSFKAAHPKIVEQKGWVIFKINFDRNEIIADGKKINGQITTVKIKDSNFSNNVNPAKELNKKIINLEKKIGTSLRALSKKSLNKKDTIKFISEYVLILEDERSDGKVTYFFNDKEYIRYKNFKKISSGAWRFTKTGTLRVFNNDIKLSWKIKLGKENNINIKPKFDPIGKLYQFDYQTKKNFLKELDDFNNKKEAEKKRLEQEKLDAQKKIDDEKKRLVQEKLDAQKKAEEEKKRLEQEKLDAQKKAEEEKKRLEQEKLDAQKKAEEEKKRLELEKLDAQKKADEEKAKMVKEMAEQKRKLEEEKAKLEKQIAEQKRKLEEEKLFYDLEPKYKKKCQKKMFNDLYEVGTPEYKQCIINKGPEKQNEEQKQNDEKAAKEEKKRLEQEKLEAQKKADEEKKRLEQEKLEAQKKAEEASITTYKNPIELMPNIVDALEEKRLSNLAGNKIRIKKVQIFALNDSTYLDSGYITIGSDYSVKSWQVVCKLKDQSATNFLKQSKGKSMIEVEITGTILGYRRNTGMLLDPCEYK